MSATAPPQVDPPDPYAIQQPVFPHQDLYEVRPQGSSFRRGRGWALTGLIVLAIGGIIASDWISKSRPAVASNGMVDRFGVSSIPDETTITPPPAEVKAVGPEKKGKPKAPPKRKSALGMGNGFDNPSESYAAREVASWNSSGNGSRSAVANRRQSALGN
jgi:hypothetical protein